MDKENTTSSSNGEEKVSPKCRLCGFVTPFDPNSEGYVCPVCGAPTKPKKQGK